MKKINVLMIGPARSVKGGMTTVVDGYYDGGLNNKVNLKYIETVNDKNAFSKIIKMIKGFFQFLFYVNKYDIIHVHMASRLSTFRKGLYVRIANSKKKKIIIHIHGAEYKIFYEQECNEKKKKYIRNTLKLATKIIVLSEEWEDYFKTLVDKEKIIVLYNAIILPKDFKKNVNSNKILFLGRIGQRKGIYDLLVVFEKLIQKHQDIKLYIGGDGEVEKLQKIIKEKRLNKNVEYIGWTSGKKKDQYLRESSIYILPSYNEGMPMSVLEGMAYKNITISTNVGGIPKVINNMKNGILLKPGDIKSMYKYINMILEDDNLRKKLSINGRDTIEKNFNVNENINTLIKIYIETLEMRGD